MQNNNIKNHRYIFQHASANDFVLHYPGIKITISNLIIAIGLYPIAMYFKQSKRVVGK